jgi:hypothetical protein
MVIGTQSLIPTIAGVYVSREWVSEMKRQSSASTIWNYARKRGGAMCSLARMITTSLVLTCIAVDVHAVGIVSQDVHASITPHVYSAQEIGAMFKRPKDIEGLLWNLKLAWDKKLLVQPRFYDDQTLMRLFNATAIVWEMPPADVSPDFTIKKATVTLDRTLFAGVPLAVQWTHELAKAQPHPEKPGVLLAGYIQDTGGISMNVESLPGFTWGAVVRVFGSGAKNIGTEPISEGPPGKPAGKALMRYLYPGDDPSKLDETQLSKAMFLLKGRPLTVFDSLKSDDVVTFVAIGESQRYYP